MQIIKSRYVLLGSSLFLMSLALRADEGPSTPRKKRGRVHSMMTPPSKRQKVTCDGNTISDAFGKICSSTDSVVNWWRALSPEARKRMVRVRDEQGKTLAHHLVLKKNPFLATIAINYPQSLLSPNDMYALPIDYVDIKKPTKAEMMALQATHQEFRKSLRESSANLPEALNALVVNMIMGDMGPGYRA